jgi:hypothetical protein
MASIITCYETTERTAKASLNSPRALHREFEVEVDSPYITQDVVISLFCALTGIVLGRGFPTWLQAILQDIDAKPFGDSPVRWLITCDYAEPSGGNADASNAQDGTGTEGGGGSSGQTPPAPSTQTAPPKGSFRLQPTKYAEQDLDGKPYVDVLGVKLENPPPQEEVIGTIAIPMRYLRDGTKSSRWFQSKLGATNDGPYGDYLSFELKIAGVEFQAVGPYWDVNWTCEYKETGWHPTKALSYGASYLVPSEDGGGVISEEFPGEVVLKKDKDGRPTGERFFHDKKGRMANLQKPLNDPGTETEAGGAWEMWYRQAKVMDFSEFL